MGIRRRGRGQRGPWRSAGPVPPFTDEDTEPREQDPDLRPHRESWGNQHFLERAA